MDVQKKRDAPGNRNIAGDRVDGGSRQKQTAWLRVHFTLGAAILQGIQNGLATIFMPIYWAFLAST